MYLRTHTTTSTSEINFLNVQNFPSFPLFFALLRLDLGLELNYAKIFVRLSNNFCLTIDQFDFSHYSDLTKDIFKLFLIHDTSARCDFQFQRVTKLRFNLLLGRGCAAVDDLKDGAFLTNPREIYCVSNLA